MMDVIKIDTTNKAQVRRFVRFPFDLYQDNPYWVPPLMVDSETQLNRNKHPFYEHSDADFFLAIQDGDPVGRIAVLENRSYNRFHDTRQAQFYLFDCIDEQDVAQTLFARAYDWARSRDLNKIVGPKGFGALDGYGLLIEGFDHRQMMTMMNYNYPYYPALVSALGFEKVVDFESYYFVPREFRLPARVMSIAERVQKRGTLKVHRFKSKGELKSWGLRIGKAYNKAFIDNWEYYPLTDNEIKFLVDNIMIVAHPRLIKIITHNDEVVGFLFGFQDVSSALQRAKGRLFPFGLPDLLLELRRTRWIAINGAGILPEFQGRGGNALLYAEIVDTVSAFNFEHAEGTQVAETAVQMRNDMAAIGGKAYKVHRVYEREI